MATFKSDLAEGQSAKGDNRVDGRLLAGKVRQVNATVTLAGTETTGDTIEVVTLPTGALINLSESYIVTESLGTTFTCDLGFGGSGDINSGIDLSSAGKVSLVDGGVLAAVDAGEEKIELTVTSAAGTVAAATARVVITFIDRN